MDKINKYTIEKYLSGCGSPINELYKGNKLIAIKSYDKIVKINDQELFKEFLKEYPNERKNLIKGVLNE